MQFKEFAVLTRNRGGTDGLWTVDRSAQNASISATDLVAATSVDGGLYVVKGIARVTTAAGTSSSLNVKIGYTDNETSTSITSIVEGFIESIAGAGIVITPTNSVAIGGIFYFSKVINAKAGVAIQYLTTYASNAAGVMVYSLHLVASRF